MKVRGRLLRPPRAAPPRLVRALLALCDALRPLYRSLGVDYPVFRALLEAKLVLDARRGRGGDPAGRMFQNAGFAAMLLMYLFFGLLLGLGVHAIEEPFWSATLVQTAVALLLALPLFMDFSAVLLDTADLTVVAPLPVGDRTFLAVRLTHIALYVGLIVGALELGPLVVGALRYPPWVYVPVLVASALCVGLTTLAAVVAFYLVALRTVAVARFRDALVYVQLGVFLSFYLATQIGPHVLRKTGLDEWLAARPELIALLPTAGYGSALRLALGEGRPVDRWLAPVALALPFLAVGAVLLLSRRGFVAALAALEQAGGPAPRRRARRGLTGRACAWLLRGGPERAGAAFFLALSAAERGYRLRTIPQVAVVLVPVLMLVFLGEEASDEHGPVLARVAPYLPYLLLVLVLGAWENARFSESHEAAWCLAALEEEQQRRFVRGALVAVLVRYLALPALALLALGCALLGAAALPGLVFACGLSFLAAARGLPRFARFVPFTERYSFGRAQSNVGLSLLAAFAIGLLALVHFGLSRVPGGLAVGAALAALASVHAARRLPRARLALH